MSPNTQALIERYENGIQQLEQALGGVSGEAVDRLPAPGKWSIRQIATHLADGEIVGGARIRWIAAQPGSTLVAYDQDKWAALISDKLPLEQSLAVFRSVRQATATLLRNLPESAWSNTGNHEERGETSLQHFVELYAEHAESHCRQIRELRAKFASAAA